tara:strand:+ start:639 stop:2030 length:1392 start_codon:yes stop_codon:yes gene_type:complete
MEISKKNINKILIYFFLAHLTIWTLIPTASNNNLPLDTIEALAWSTNLDWGYNKHPPLSAWFVELFYQIFGNQDWAYYLLSQIFVVFSFFIVFKFSEDFFKDKSLSLISILLLEGIYFYNFTTPEFNVNVCQLPFWALSVYYCWKSIKQDDTQSWVLFGLFLALGVLSKYLFFYLIIAIKIFFIHKIFIKREKIKLKYIIPGSIFILILLPHLIWLIENNYATITYALYRTEIENVNFFKSHFLYPLFFLGKQIGILVPFFIMLLFLISKFKIKINFKEKKLLFLLIINLVPIFLMFLTSMFMGIKIRTMWMTPFYLFMGVLFIYIFKTKIFLKKLKYFFSIFMVLFIFSPLAYLYVSMIQVDKRTDYPGKRIAQIVQEKWKNNFTDKIMLVGGDEWHGGNLSYHIKSRPKWDNILEAKKTILPENIKGGFILIGDGDILSKICNGIYLEVEKQGICMIGKRK